MDQGCDFLERVLHCGYGCGWGVMWRLLTVGVMVDEMRWFGFVYDEGGRLNETGGYVKKW